MGSIREDKEPIAFDQKQEHSMRLCCKDQCENRTQSAQDQKQASDKKDVPFCSTAQRNPLENKEECDSLKESQQNFQNVLETLDQTNKSDPDPGCCSCT